METNRLKENQTKKKSKVAYYIFGAIFLLAAGIFIWQYYQGKTSADEDDTVYTTTAVTEPIYPDTENYDYYNKLLFDINEYDGISQNYREGIMKVFKDNGFFEPAEGERRFSMTKIKDRASKVYSFGDFTGQTKNNEPELAFLIQSEDANESKLFIISNDRDVLFRKDYSDAPIINSFKKGSKIFMESEKLQPSPKDGLIIKSKNSKYALVYNESSKNFDEFYQYTNQDLIDNKNEREDYQEVSDEPEETP
ncbi:hypothetical protein LUD75_05120 [Epilithonimonas sp. JDS]|uniref:hypothetical protein n=1 Tax=Epilithonimonas sp. JDS TaxID=2902797 RepID=UPI001E496F69|nr:hypothetical protein [Epilithonimonas sp. JDS]MCD9854071.1 hypothetical protein [Epilithonimonas sp. JDS]